MSRGKIDKGRKYSPQFFHSKYTVIIKLVNPES